MTRMFFFWVGRRLVLAALALVGAGLALFAYMSVSSANLSTGDNVGWYTSPSSDCQDTDIETYPINVVFYWGATPENVYKDFVFLGDGTWTENGERAQYFKTNGVCNRMDDGFSIPDVAGARYHVRERRGVDSSGTVYADPNWYDYSLGAADYEQYSTSISCQEYPWKVPPGGFDQGRDEVVSELTAHGWHFAGLQPWGNTSPRIQCEGYVVSSQDGKVAFIRATAGDVGGMSYSSAPLASPPYDLWYCTGQHCGQYNGGGTLFVADWLGNGSRIGIGSFSFRTTFDTTLLSASMWPSTLLGSTGRNVTASETDGPGYIDYGATSSGDPGNAGPREGNLASLVLKPTSKAADGMRPTRAPAPTPSVRATTGPNWRPISIYQQYCKVRDVLGIALPGAGSDGSTGQCAGATVVVHMLEGDLSKDCEVDVTDDQMEAFRYGACNFPNDFLCTQNGGNLLYDKYYDLEPWLPRGDGDGDVDIKDLQFVFGRTYSTCHNPFPYDQVANYHVVESAGAARDESGIVSSEAPAAVRVDPPTQNVDAVGRQFTVDVGVDDAVQLGAYDLRLQFDPNVVQYVGVNNGSFLGSTGRVVSCPAPIHVDDQVAFGCGTIGSEVSPPDGSGVLATFTFQAVAPGTSPLDLTEVGLSGVFGDSADATSTSGRVSVMDADGDGLPDNMDNCPTVYNPDQVASGKGPRPTGPSLPTHIASNPANDPQGDACDPDPPPTYYNCTGWDHSNTDGDGIQDCVEHLYGTCAFTSDSTVDYSSCANPVDSDGDMCPDWLEMMDVNGDRKVDSGDQLIVARRVAGLIAPEPTQDAVLDVNHDGLFNSTDNLWVAKNTCQYKGYTCPCGPE